MALIKEKSPLSSEPIHSYIYTDLSIILFQCQPKEFICAFWAFYHSFVPI
ncbi:MAG: hypothetical protein ACD_8C00005G0005 [uncultured bacterium]|nr:MAG: hypothetical protein ACD_8C00005G0005 [uncultured bacterium]